MSSRQFAVESERKSRERSSREKKNINEQRMSARQFDLESKKKSNIWYTKQQEIENNLNVSVAADNRSSRETLELIEDDICHQIVPTENNSCEIISLYSNPSGNDDFCKFCNNLFRF
jgi:hypothetical protein